MRTLALLLVLTSACNWQGRSRIRYVRGLAEHATSLQCLVAPAPFADQDVAELKAFGTDQLIAVVPGQRRVALIDDSLRVAWSMVFDSVGSQALNVPISATILDSVLYVVDRQKRVLRRFALNGAALTDIPLDFLPVQVNASGGKLFVTPAVLGRYPGSLLYVLRGTTPVAQPVKPRAYSAVSVGMLGNATAVAGLRDEVLILHQFITPRAYIWRDGAVHRVPVPLATEFRRRVGYVPPLPLDEQALRPMLVVALAAAADSARAKYMLLVRSGRMQRGRYEKALLETDDGLRVNRAFLLPVNAGTFALLASRRTAIALDEENKWYQCPLP
jgi:hypothetical protein